MHFEFFDDVLTAPESAIAQACAKNSYWEPTACIKVMLPVVLSEIRAMSGPKPVDRHRGGVTTGSITHLGHTQIDPANTALLLSVPASSNLAQALEIADVPAASEWVLEAAVDQPCSDLQWTARSSQTDVGTPVALVVDGIVVHLFAWAGEYVSNICALLRPVDSWRTLLLYRADGNTTLGESFCLPSLPELASARVWLRFVSDSMSCCAEDANGPGLALVQPAFEEVGFSSECASTISLRARHVNAAAVGLVELAARWHRLDHYR